MCARSSAGAGCRAGILPAWFGTHRVFEGEMRTLRKICLYIFLSVLPAIISAQEKEPQGSQPQNQKPDQQPSMPGMDMPNMHHHHPGMKMDMKTDHHPSTFIEEIENHASSGTDAQPDSTPTPMLMTMRGNWMLMLHGTAFVI